MITSLTYRDRIDRRRDMLAGFSALDHRTTGSMDEVAVEHAYRGLLARIAALLFLHGPGVPAEFISAARSTDADLVTVASSFLEHGEESTSAVSELQQELVHFSRIVDVGPAGFEDAEAERALRRLRNSHRLPEPLKVLSELVIVMRSRMLQRGADLEVPLLRSGRTVIVDAPESFAATFPESATEHVVFVRSARRRDRRQICWLISALLAYLTPTEAAIAIWAFQMANEVPLQMSLILVTTLPGGRQARLVSWSTHLNDVEASCGLQLPVVDAVPREQLGALLREAGFPATCSIVPGALRVDFGNRVCVLSDPTAPVMPSTEAMRQATRDGLRGVSVPVRSMECGHVHLDRDLDVDQDLGIALGQAAYEVLAARQPSPPLLTPMLDDDHVLVRLRPKDYTAYVNERMPGHPMHLIVESSPVIRSIVVVLYQRLLKLAPERLRTRGGNLFAQIGNGTFCELFEDIAGTMATGCVFFEAALLTYRSAPDIFDAHFRDRFGLHTGVHETACAILDGDEPHDDKVSRLAAFYRQFAAVTDPQRPDQQVTALVAQVLDVSEPIAHLNVLENYYEVQQHKVRHMLALLQLPMRLLTVHFDARTGRIVFDA